MRTLGVTGAILVLLCLVGCLSRPTPYSLAQAVEDGDAALLEVLLRKGGDPNATLGDRNSTMLHMAAASNHRECVSVLIAAGAVVDAVTATGDTPLSSAAATGAEDAIRILLSNGADSAHRGQRGYPLRAAIMCGNLGAARALLQGGASPNVTAPEEWSALDDFDTIAGRACHRRFTPQDKAALRQLLLEHGAEYRHPYIQLEPYDALRAAAGLADANYVTRVGKELDSEEQALHICSALRDNDTDVLHALADAGWDFDAEDQYGNRPIEATTDSGATQYLLAHGARDTLVAALRRRDEDAALKLIEGGADLVVLVSDEDPGWGPLEWADHCGMELVSRELRKRGERYDLWYAIEIDDARTVAERLREGESADSGYAHWSYLHNAASRNCLSAARVLLDAGAPLNEPDGYGTTPLDVADGEGHKRMARLLRRYGAKNGSGWPPKRVGGIPH